MSDFFHFTSEILWRFPYFVIWISCWFLFIAEQVSIIWIYCNLFIHLLVDGHFSFHFGTILNKKSMKVYLQGFLCNLCFHFSWVNTRNGVAEPFYKKLLNCFQSGFIILHSYQQWVSFNCFTSSSQLGIVSLILTILAMTWWYPTVALAYVSQMTINAEYLFSFLFAVYVFALVISVFTFLPLWKQIICLCFAWVLFKFWIQALYEMCLFNVFSYFFYKVEWINFIFYNSYLLLSLIINLHLT